MRVGVLALILMMLTGCASGGFGVRLYGEPGKCSKECRDFLNGTGTGK